MTTSRAEWCRLLLDALTIGVVDEGNPHLIPSLLEQCELTIDHGRIDLTPILMGTLDVCNVLAGIAAHATGSATIEVVFDARESITAEV